MISWKSFRHRISESAIHFALDAFWVAVWGVVSTGITTAILAFRGASPYLLVALSSVAGTLLFVLIGTSAVVWIQRRTRLATHPRPIGRKGFLDYKIQGLRALGRMTGALSEMTPQMERIGRKFTSDLAAVERAQRRRTNPDELTYRLIGKTARHLEKRASAIKLHALKYASDVNLFIEGTGKWLDWLLAKGIGDPQELHQFATVLEQFRTSKESAIDAMERFRKTLNEGREVSEEMDLAGASLDEAVELTIDAAKKASAFCTAQIPRLR